MDEDALTFSELRKIEKKEKRNDDLSDLGSNFFLRVSNYLDMKESDQREYRNARRVFDKIIGLRQEKIVKNARIAVKSGLNASDLNMLPREKELFRDVKNVFHDYSDKVDDVVEGNETASVDGIELEDDLEEEEAEIDEVEDKAEEESGEDEEEIEEGYQKIKIISEVPEFMGTDVESYGPFEEGEEAVVPEENAEILANRGSAEIME